MKPSHYMLILFVGTWFISLFHSDTSAVSQDFVTGLLVVFFAAYVVTVETEDHNEDS